MDLTLTDLEHAINYWRALRPSTGEERALSSEVKALATLYATMIFYRQTAVSADTVDQAVRQLIEAGKQQPV